LSLFSSPNFSLGSYSDAHSNTITQLKFHPTQSALLASASEDWLVCTYDTSISSMEDAVVSTLNTESPINRFGFFGEQNDAIYALSTNETLSFWHHPSAQRVAYFNNIRESLGVDYLVDCFSNTSISGGGGGSNDIYLVAGGYSGGGVVAQMLPTGYNVVGRLEGGHNANIRCCSAAFTGAGWCSFLLVVLDYSSA
jgi:WD40 repeat protein